MGASAPFFCVDDADGFSDQAGFDLKFGDLDVDGLTARSRV
ncbi:hypothetical protein [Phormidesmis sp. 146-33]